MSEEITLSDVSVRFINALLDAADVQVIGVGNWWHRATAALETAADGAENAAHAVSIASRKLQVEVIGKEQAEILAEITPVIDARFREWQETVAREAPYIIALARLAREERKNARKRETQLSFEGIE